MDKQDAVSLAKAALLITEPIPSGDGSSLTERLLALIRSESLLADRHFAVQMAGGVIEDELDEALLAALGIDYNDPAAWPCKDITYDYYDTSFELKRTRPDWTPTLEGLEKAWALGFSRCWICYGAKGDPDYAEKYFTHSPSN